jgi:ribose transport system substrate-binding protein
MFKSRHRGIRRLRPVLAVGAGLLLVGVAGCSSSSSSSETTAPPASSAAASSESAAPESSAPADLPAVPAKRIAYVEIFLQAPIEMRINNAFVESAQAVGWEVTTTDVQADPQKANDAINSAILQAYDAIVLGSVEPALVQESLKKAQEAGIPVIAMGGESRHDLDALLSAVYTEDDTSLSEPLAAKLCDELEPGSEIGLLRFDLFYSGQLRGDTIKAGAEACGLKVVAEPEAEQTLADSQAKTAAIINQFPNLAAMVPVYDTFTAGTVQAIKAAKKQDQIDVYSYYADAINNPLMRDNENVVALADCDCVIAAPFTVNALLDLWMNSTPLAPTLPDGTITYGVVTRDNIPPEGQDGPVTVESVLTPFVEQWRTKYAF